MSGPLSLSYFILSHLPEVDIFLPFTGKYEQVSPRKVKPPDKLVVEGPGMSNYKAQVLPTVKWRLAN